MIDFEFLIRKNIETHIHADVELFYIMEGTVCFVLESKTYIMKKDDFIVVNIDQKHSFHTKEDILVASLHISYPTLCKMMKREMLFFWCNTTVDSNEVTDEVQGILKKIIREQYQNKGTDEIYMNSLYFDLLHVLTTDFVLNKKDKRYEAEEHKFDDRKHKIAEYVRLNYDKQISLNELAQKLFLSNAYLSKYIKRQFSMNFIDYVNSVRLNYAVSQLLYSDQSVVRIAMDTGFASSAALNKAFKDKYEMTPTLYRNQWRTREGKNHNTVEEEKSIQEQIVHYFHTNENIGKREKRLSEESVVISSITRQPLEKVWGRMINVGAAADLLHSDMQQHIIYLKENLKFTYVRFWDLYSPELMLNDNALNNSLNFDKLNRILDFLEKNGLKPYIELRIKPKKIVKNQTDVLLARKAPDDNMSEENLRGFMSAFIIHMINRYTADRVESWCFEVWKTEREEYLNITDIADKDKSVPIYLDRFELIAGTLREYLPAIKIGGGGFSLRWGEENFTEILQQWKQRENLPDFISVYNYPYTVDSIDKDKNQTLDADYLRHNLTRIRELMKLAEFPVKELHVTEWSFSVSNRNVLNDHCMKGAYLVKNMIDGLGLVDLMGYWVGSDLFADYYDSKMILNGSGGLISKDGIPKPAFYAFEFMNRLGKYLIKAGERYIVSDNGKGNFRIVCHNLKKLSYQYGLAREDKILVEDQDDLFTDMKKNRMRFELPVKKQGKYLLRIYLVNEKHGSLQNEWMEMMADAKAVGPEELDYLGRITTPRMVLVNSQEQNGKLVFDTVLEPNEIQFIHVAFQY